MPEITQEKNKALLLEGFDLLFNQRNFKTAERILVPELHSAQRSHTAWKRGLFDLVKELPREMKYENSLILAEGDYVMAHGRYTRPGQANWIVVDVIAYQGRRL